MIYVPVDKNAAGCCGCLIFIAGLFIAFCIVVAVAGAS